MIGIFVVLTLGFASAVGNVPDKWLRINAVRNNQILESKDRVAEMSGLKSTIIIDVDDVVLHHRAHLTSFLLDSGVEVAQGVTELDWWLVTTATGAILSPHVTEELLAGGFRSFAHNQKPIEGAISALKQLSKDHSVLLLTNFPTQLLDVRIKRLAELDLAFRLICNSGGKGRFVQSVQAQSASPVIFVDDSERQIRNVKKHSPRTITVRADIVKTWREPNMANSAADTIAHSWLDIVRFIQR